MDGPIKKSRVKIERNKVGVLEKMFNFRVKMMSKRKGTELIKRKPAKRRLLYLLCPLRVIRKTEKKMRRKADIALNMNIKFKPAFSMFIKKYYFFVYMLYVNSCKEVWVNIGCYQRYYF
jgi:hypothetical protein